MSADRMARLARVIALELSMSCRNQSVFGGFDRFVDRELPGLELPASQLEDLRALTARYARSTPDRRRDIIASLSTRLLLSAAPASATPPAPPARPAVPAPRTARVAPVAPARPARVAPVAPARPAPAPPRAPALPPPELTLDTAIQYLRGIGPRRADLLTRLDIKTIRDLIWHLPFRYEDRSCPRPLADLTPGHWQAFRARIVKKSSSGSRGRGTTKATAEDGSGTIELVWFGARYVAARLTRGDEYHFFARPQRSRGKLIVPNPEFEPVGPGAPPAGHVPVYPNTAGLPQRFLRRQIAHVVDLFHADFPEFLPAPILAAKDLPSRSGALLDVHRPPCAAAAERARRRLAYEELLVMQLALQLRKRRTGTDVAGVVCPDRSNLFETIEPRLAFRFTNAQRRVLADLRADLARPSPMARLLQGDVGSGKTVVALTALLAAVGDGFQGAIMAPTEILAEQHYLSISRTCERFGVGCALVTGSQGKRERAAALEGLRSGSTGIAVGTHALIEDGVQFCALGLVVVDEQHRFGVVQRDRLVSKGLAPNVLVMTATPIPRTLALTLYGDLDVSVLDELPPGRQPITTRWVPPAKLERVWAQLDRDLEAGHQAYVVCPLVEESEEVPHENAVALHDKLARGPFAHRRVGLLHGQMRAAEKDAVMSAFRAHELDVLVATTVVEVGVDVANATAMVIVDAHAFGLAQLHQLRGRIGRGSGASTCWLVAAPQGPAVRARLQAMVHTQDGFRIAEADLEQRGPGELFGTRQAGLPPMRIAQLTRDLALLEEAQADARALLAEDPELTAPGREKLRDAAEERYRAFIVH